MIHTLLQGELACPGRQNAEDTMNMSFLKDSMSSSSIAFASVKNLSNSRFLRSTTIWR
jgi:hypothetical protein